MSEAIRHLADYDTHQRFTATVLSNDRITPESSPEEIPRGSGAVLRRGLSKVAAYRDENGALHEVSAVCPHLKCIVEWNPAAKTWDCPCHGSRFDRLGKVTNGPANVDLAPVDREAAQR